jgi:hypothetical protein
MTPAARPITTVLRDRGTVLRRRIVTTTSADERISTTASPNAGPPVAWVLAMMTRPSNTPKPVPI